MEQMLSSICEAKQSTTPKPYLYLQNESNLFTDIDMLDSAIFQRI